MTFDEFMKLPLDSRKRIEEKIVDLDRAIQSEYGFSMLDTEKRLARKLNEGMNTSSGVQSGSNPIGEEKNGD